jgi:hypothetical protein
MPDYWGTGLKIVLIIRIRSIIEKRTIILRRPSDVESTDDRFYAFRSSELKGLHIGELVHG